jgi:hypothetical protein
MPTISAPIRFAASLMSLEVIIIIPPHFVFIYILAQNHCTEKPQNGNIVTQNDHYQQR